MTKRGLVLFIGATGAGKSTSMASMLGYRNENSYGHIITIEDPIEFVHEHKNCVVTQREVGVDCDGWQVALKNTLRQAPDVILIGEVRERETMDYAVSFAETGHLCLATLHANSTNQALDRIVNFFPEERRAQLLMDLSLNVRAFVAQRLIPRRDGRGRVPAVEVMLNSPLISDLIFKGDVSGIKDIMKKSRELGMQTFDQSLFDLYEAGLITLRGRAAQRGFAQRPAARDQAARQGSEEPQRVLRYRQPRHRAGSAEHQHLSFAPSGDHWPRDVVGTNASRPLQYRPEPARARGGGRAPTRRRPRGHGAVRRAQGTDRLRRYSPARRAPTACSVVSRPPATPRPRSTCWCRTPTQPRWMPRVTADS